MFARPMRAGWAGGGGAAPTVPDKPTSIGAVSGNGQVTVNVVAHAPGDLIQVVYKLATSAAWIVNAAYQRTGSGAVVIGGLTNGSLYQFMAYTLLGTLESPWIGPASSVPLAPAALGSYTQFISDLRAAVKASVTLAAAVTDGNPAAHVLTGRYLFTDAATLAAILAGGPAAFVRYVPYGTSPLTHENAKGAFTAELTIVQQFDQTESDDLTAESDFVEKLKQELTSGVDGSGTRWTARGYAVKVSVAEPKVEVKDQLSHIVRFAVGYSEAI